VRTKNLTGKEKENFGDLGQMGERILNNQDTWAGLNGFMVGCVVGHSEPFAESLVIICYRFPHQGISNDCIIKNFKAFLKWHELANNT